MGDAGFASVLGVVLICVSLLALSDFSEATVYTVGDGSGWTFNLSSWPNGKKFNAGDVLVFNYSPEAHNVVAVDAAGYNGCSAAPGSKVYDSGNDQITLVSGKQYFICSVPGHCDGGMKIEVDAA